MVSSPNLIPPHVVSSAIADYCFVLAFSVFSIYCKSTLQTANVTHVLSTLRVPLDEDAFSQYSHLIIEVDDMDHEDLLQHFARANSFIQTGLDGGGGVLVHW